MAGFVVGRGADVNHVDKKGMTPLLYAASIDFGNSALIDLLVKSGARLDARIGEGLTALDSVSASIFRQVSEYTSGIPPLTHYEGAPL